MGERELHKEGNRPFRRFLRGAGRGHKSISPCPSSTRKLNSQASFGSPSNRAFCPGTLCRVPLTPEHYVHQDHIIRMSNYLILLGVSRKGVYVIREYSIRQTAMPFVP
jgi:hypothetical protein